MLTNPIKLLLIAGAILIPISKPTCDFKDKDCRSEKGCECVSEDCEPSKPHPKPQ